ncbi:unnamed protein product [Clonostachys rhizophaga]|uniref:Zn(2)-C6 fungal-type domain-containing protein n=1 Tax=Clonostachys rhizophaga TaxID=160324 RepID=A0A9N9VB65_9HYPO|nr:unnamed protein product [Clonostachys rhizophaga]
MPGVPRSKGCQTCKRRKIKCDETWPTCIQCRHINADCPGPTSLVKFINNGSHRDGQSPPSDGRRSPSKSPPRQTQGSSSSTLQLRKIYYPNVNDRSAEYGLLQVTPPRANPTTLAERVATRLVGNLDKGANGITSLQMSYLPQLPSRLADSPCLRDSVDLFCAAWADFRRRQPQGELMAMPQYGKVLRSLRRTLMSEQALKVETLAAMVLLERTCKLFDRGKFSSIHHQGILQMMERKGPPDLNDDLDITVTNEVHGLMISGYSVESCASFIEKSEWNEVMANCAFKHPKLSNLEPITSVDLMIIYDFSKDIFSWLNTMHQIRTNPHGDENEAVSIIFEQKLRDMLSKVRKLAAESIELAMKEGAVTERDDPASIVGKRIDFKSALMCQVFMSLHLIQMTALRMLYEMSVVYSSPDPELWDQFREVAVENWKAMPYILSLESIVASNTIATVFIGYEAGNEEEKRYLQDVMLSVDEYLGRYPKDRARLDTVLLEAGKLLTGLKPVLKELPNNR